LSNHIEKNIKVETSQHTHFHAIDDIAKEGLLFAENFFNSLFNRVAAEISVNVHRPKIDDGKVSWCALPDDTKAIPIPVPLKGAAMAGYVLWPLA
jgi:hypothetical protein